jgi:hypothetical protein
MRVPVAVHVGFVLAVCDDPTHDHGGHVHHVVNGIALCSPQGVHQRDDWPLGLPTEPRTLDDFIENGCGNCRSRLNRNSQAIENAS